MAAVAQKPGFRGRRKLMKTRGDFPAFGAHQKHMILGKPGSS
jgi:hypothetical protein